MGLLLSKCYAFNFNPLLRSETDVSHINRRGYVVIPIITVALHMISDIRIFISDCIKYMLVRHDQIYGT
jgi:hypothetical protein